jgi:hypothetical protein
MGDETAEDLKTMGMRNWHTMTRYQKEWGRATLEANVHDRL